MERNADDGTYDNENKKLLYLHGKKSAERCVAASM